MMHPNTKYYFLLFNKKYQILQNQTLHAFYLHH